MKIAFIIGKFPSLSETFILNQITGLIDRGHQIHIYAESPDVLEKVHNDVRKYALVERTHYLPTPAPALAKRVFGALSLFATRFRESPFQVGQSLNVRRYGRQAASLRLIYPLSGLLGRERSYDVVHCHFGPYGVRGMFLRDVGVMQGKLAITFHAADIAVGRRAYGDRVYGRLFRAGDLFLPISEYWENELIKLGCPRQKILVHRMGIDCKEFSFTPRKRKSNVAVRLITVCRLVEKKGVEYAVRAVAKLQNNGANVTHDIIGDGPLRSKLARLVSDLGMSSSILMHGWKEKKEVIDMLHRADILLAPSVTAKNGDQEGIPVSLMEAMAMGLPVVSTLHSGIPELIEDGISGFLVPERDVDALKQKLAYLIDHPQIWASISEAARKVVEQRFNIDTLNDELVQVFQRIVSKPVTN